MKLKYRHTQFACYIGYITQAIIVNLAPLLFVTFEKSLGISIAQLGMLISINFGTQIIADLVCTKIVDKAGRRNCMIAACVFSVIGIGGMSVFPFIMPPFYGLALSYIICAVGGGLIEVLVSLITESLPNEEKSQSMSLLHSFYSFGQAGVVVLSTLFFNIAGIEN